MNHKQASKWPRLGVWCILAAALPIGCNPLVTTSAFPAQDPIKRAEYPLVFQDGPKKGKEVSVALFISNGPGNDPLFIGSHEKLAADMSKKLPEMASEAKQTLTVIDPSLVHRFKLKNQNWSRMHASEWGKRLKADFVLDIRLDKMSLYQPGSQKAVYDGRAEITVDVYDVDAGIAEPKYHYVFPFNYPHNAVLDAATIPLNHFKQDYLENLATEISMKHVEHKVSSETAKGP